MKNKKPLKMWKRARFPFFSSSKRSLKSMVCDPLGKLLKRPREMRTWAVSPS